MAEAALGFAYSGLASTQQEEARPGPPFAAYLTRLAMNRCIDHSRRQKFRRFIGLEEAPEPMDPGQSPAAAAEARSEVGAVARLVLDLPARQRAAILVAAEGGQSSSEVAAVLGISTGAAEQLLVRARRTLRARLAAAETKGENDDDR